MLTDGFVVLLWVLIFFILFYLYMDIRLGHLRKEILSHYLECEKTLLNTLHRHLQKLTASIPAGQNSRTVSSNPDAGCLRRFDMRNQFLDSASPSLPTLAEVIPSREETLMGINNIASRTLPSIHHLHKTGLAGGANEWSITGDPGWNRFTDLTSPGNGVQAFNAFNAVNAFNAEWNTPFASPI